MQPRRAAIQRPAVLANAQQPSRRHRPDYQLLVLSAALLAIGLIVVYAISPGLAVQHNKSASYYVLHQVITIGLAVVAFAVMANIPYRFWAGRTKLLIGAAFLVTLAAMIMRAPSDYPAHRWVILGSFSFQSVELLKFALLISLSSFLGRQMENGRIRNFSATLRPLLFILLGLGIVVAGIQSDLGSTGVILAMMGTMAFVAGLPMRRLLYIFLAVVVLAGVATAVVPYRRERLMTYLHPEADCQNTGYQACQALIAVGSGGMIGLGLGRSVQAFGYLPEAQNDSIFAIYAEKFGFVGCIGLLAIFMAFFSRLKRIVERAPDNYSRLLVVGIAAWLGVQALINIGAMIGLLPLKGITLPFVSYGGTSVVFIMAAVGLVFNISRFTSFSAPRVTESKGGGQHDDRTDRRRIRGAYHPNPSSR